MKVPQDTRGPRELHRLRVLHVITDLRQGGAEGALYQLVSASRADIEHVVVSLQQASYFGPKLQDLGVVVHSLEKPKGRLTVSGLLRLRRIIREFKPEVVQTWMYHANLVGGVVARLSGVRAVAWGIRHSNLDQRITSLSTRLTAKACAQMSSWVPMAIASCSVEAARVHKAIGYAADKFVVIPNGYDLSHFAVNREGGVRLRNEWGAGPHDALLGMVARWDPQKDHENLLGALEILKSRGRATRCVLIGGDMNESNLALHRAILDHGLDDQIILAGPRSDIPTVMNALDLHILSSAGEAFPNVVAEAMACGTPCVVTDVGDAAFIVGSTGWVVPPGNPEALAAAIEAGLAAIMKQGRATFDRACRSRIEREFGLDRMSAAYKRLWDSIAAERGG